MYGWTPVETLEEIPWASIVALLEARAQRMADSLEPTALGDLGDIAREVAPGVYGLGLGGR